MHVIIEVRLGKTMQETEASANQIQGFGFWTTHRIVTVYQVPSLNQFQILWFSACLSKDGRWDRSEHYCSEV